MENRELLNRVEKRAQNWLSSEYDEDTRNEVLSLLQNNDKTELIDAFYKDLEFGTGGLRGIMGAGSNRMNRYTVSMATQGLCNYLRQTFSGEEIAVVVGYDCRNNSRFFAETAANVFSANGIKVYIFDALRPTPEISYAIRKLQCKSGVMITASHNPKEYNGYKTYWSDGAQIIAPHDARIIEEVSKITTVKDVKAEPNAELIVKIGENIDVPFVEDVASLSLSPQAIERQCSMGIVYTPIHGTGVFLVPRTLQAMGFKNIIRVPEQDVVSGDFPTVASPNPEEPAAMDLALRKAEEMGASLVLASDPDGDRLGVAIRNRRGNLILLNGNQICSLLIYYSIVRRQELGIIKPNDYIVKTIVTTELVSEIAKKYNVEVYDCYTGFKWIAHVIKENEGLKNYIGGGEESYGFLWEDFIRDKSSVSACAMFAEFVAWLRDRNLTVDELLAKIYQEFGFFLEKGVSVVKKGREGSQEIEQMMTNFRQTPPKFLAGELVTDIFDYKTLIHKDLLKGSEVSISMPQTSNVLQFRTNNGTVLSIRPSGTEPKIKFYVGVRASFSQEESEEQVRKILQQRIDTICAQLGEKG